MIEHAVELWGRIDVLVNNAATGAITPLEAVTTEQLSSIFTLNLCAPIWLSKAALSALTESRGAIVTEAVLRVNHALGVSASPFVFTFLRDQDVLVLCHRLFLWQ